MEDDYLGQRWTKWFLWKEDIKLSHIHCQLSAVCGQKAPTHRTGSTGYGSLTVVRKTTQAAVHKWSHSTLKQWFCEAILNLPTGWQQCVT